MGVTAKSLDKNDIISFRYWVINSLNGFYYRIRDQGKVQSLNFSLDSQIVSIQRDKNSVDFVFLTQKVSTNVQQEVKLVCKKQGVVIIGLQWFGDRYFAFITDQGPELYLLNYKKRSIKFVKNVIINVNWFLCYVGLVFKFIVNY